MIGTLELRPPSSPGISVREGSEGRKNIPTLERQDEGQREGNKKHPIKLELPVSHSSKREYLALLWSMYCACNTRAGKSQILDEICRNLGYHRNSALRLMNRESPPKLGRGPSPSNRKFSEEAKRQLIILWHLMGRPGGKLMKAMLPDWICFYDKPCNQGVTVELLTMSKSSIDSFLKPARAEWRRKNNTGTRPARPAVQTLVPIRAMNFKVRTVGYVEADTVAHCGDSMSGSFFWSLSMTEIKSGWTTAAAVWSKTARGIRAALERAEAESFFTWKALCHDSGSEFINDIVVRGFCRDPRRSEPLLQLRGRPYRKNDQCYIEQKNNVFVRKLLGYGRLDSQKMESLINETYREWALLNNHFVPTSKLVSKTRVGSKIKKVYDVPMTPYERLLEDPDVPWHQKERLMKEHSQLNPFELRRRIKRRLAVINRWHDIDRNQRGRACA